MRILLGYGILHAMRRHKAWRGGSNAQQSCVPATAPHLEALKIEVWKRLGGVLARLGASWKHFGVSWEV